MNHASSKEISEKLGISTRQARRLRASNDSRLEKTDIAYLHKRSRERLAILASHQADFIAIATTTLEQAPQSSAGPEMDELSNIAKRLRRIVAELRSLAQKFMEE